MDFGCGHKFSATEGEAYPWPEVHQPGGGFSVRLEPQHPYQRLAGTTSRLGNLFLGGSVRTDHRVAFYPLWDDSHVYWASYLGSAFTATLEKQLSDKNSMSALFDLPIVGALSRQPQYRTYKMDNAAAGPSLIHSDMRLASVHNYFSPMLQLQYCMKYSEKFSAAYYYRFQYSRIGSESAQAYYQLSHHLGLQFIF